MRRAPPVTSTHRPARKERVAASLMARPEDTSLSAARRSRIRVRRMTTAPTELPELTPDETAHSALLVERIASVIAAEGGWIDFRRYMNLALYEPGLGYYSAGARKFGAAGDFVTAPEVAPVFSRCLAVQCAEVLQTLGAPETS